MFSLNGKTALITGSGRGIGLAIAEAMAHQGANIFLSDINSSVVERAAGELAGKYPNVAVRGLTFDVTDKAQIESAMQAIKDAGNGLQILLPAILYCRMQLPVQTRHPYSCCQP